MSVRRSFVRLFAGALVCGSALVPAVAAELKFKRTVLDEKFRSEVVAVGDFNKDGKLDIAAGSVWYAAPDWKMNTIRAKADEFKPESYSDSFVNAADDLNGDGWTDLMVVDFPGKPTWIFENPQGKPGPWPRYLLTPVTNNESPAYVDVDGSKIPAWIMGVNDDEKNPDGPDRFQAIVRRGSNPLERWNITKVSKAGAPMTTKYSHGIGVGDINGDGRNDLLCKDGWWECPSKGQTADTADWTFHPAKFGADCAHMFVYDVDGDGDNDVINSSAHKVGIWWHEQTPEGWKSHTIDESFSQSHSMCFVDMNGDGLKDIVTGKRWWAHGPKGDINPNDPAMLVWFELGRKEGRATWTMHEIDHNSGVGTQFEVVDVNGDKLLDVVVSNKKGVFYFEQEK
jgi:hypothetical protein